jgi:hypothetical protein
MLLKPIDLDLLQSFIVFVDLLVYVGKFVSNGFDSPKVQISMIQSALLLFQIGKG